MKLKHFLFIVVIVFLGWKIRNAYEYYKANPSVTSSSQQSSTPPLSEKSEKKDDNKTIYIGNSPSIKGWTTEVVEIAGETFVEYSPVGEDSEREMLPTLTNDGKCIHRDFPKGVIYVGEHQDSTLLYLRHSGGMYEKKADLESEWFPVSEESWIESFANFSKISVLMSGVGASKTLKINPETGFVEMDSITGKNCFRFPVTTTRIK